MTTIRLELWNSHAIFASQVFVKFWAFDPPFLGGRKTASKLRFFNMKWNGMGKWNFCDGFVYKKNVP
jgi:hypothetical protein